MNVTFFGKWFLQFQPAQDGQWYGYNVGTLPLTTELAIVMTRDDGEPFIVYMVEGDRSKIILQSNETLAFLSVLPIPLGWSHGLGSIIPTPATASQPEGADVLTINDTNPLQEGAYIQLQYLDWTMVWQGDSGIIGPNTIRLLLLPPNPRFPGPVPVPALRMTYRTHSLETILSSKNAQGYDLAHVILRGVDLSGCNFSNALFNGADLSGANLSNCDCSGAEFQGADLTNTVFTDANLIFSDVTGATIAGMDLRSSSSSPTGTQLVATNFTGLNVTPVHFDPVPHFSRDRNQRTIFTNAIIPYSVLGHNWSCLDLRGALVPDLPQTLSDQDHPLQARDSLLTYFQKGSLINKSLQYSNFSNSDLSSLDLSGCDFSYANLTQTLFSGANLTAATLRNVNAQGVQFGSLTRLFHLDLSLQSALNAGDFSVLAPVFKLNGRSLSASITIKKVRALWSITDRPRTLAVTKSTIDDNVQIAIQTATPVIVDSQLFPDFEASLDTLNRKEIARVLANYGVTLPDGFGAELRTALWRMEDTGASTTYVIRQDIPSRGPAVIHVYGSGAGANLADVYMPNAMLDNANFSDVTAPNIQLYGDSASLNGATLEDADFSGANLGGMSLKQVQMQGIILDRAILVNARLNAAVLTPSVKGRAASLTNANLQGADFTDALLFGANLADAAVAVQLDPADSAQGGGVYQFSLDSSYSD